MAYAIVRNGWESDFFGREIGLVDFQATPSAKTAIQFTLCRARIESTDLASLLALQQDGFELVETELNFALTLDAATIQNDGEQAIFTATLADIPDLQQHFATAFPATRFRPPYFSPKENQALYARWWDAAVKGDYDDICFLAKSPTGDIQGAMSVRVKESKADLGVLAVNPNFQRQGVAKRLFAHACRWAVSQGASQLCAATQLSNHNAIAFYQSQGMQLQGSAYWLYK